ncbi:MAG TPA: biotin/lipoyl-containing protein, partial [Bacteroidota bacterium]|nr:biotin/lipoyl-containing protein [Bacteroidota bacterium]
TVNGKELTVCLGRDGIASVDGEEYSVRRITGTEFSVMIGSRQVKVVAAAGEGGYEVIAGDFRGSVSVESERARLLRRYSRSTAGPDTRLEVHAPMPAMVIKLEAAVGDEVRAGQPLIVLEAMKMENEIVAPGGGRVKAIYATPGKPVEKGELLFLLE